MKDCLSYRCIEENRCIENVRDLQSTIEFPGTPHHLPKHINTYFNTFASGTSRGRTD